MASISETLLSLTARNGGATVSLVDGSVATHTTGFYVGGAVPTERFNTPGDLSDYATAVTNIMRQTSIGYIGSWRDGDNRYGTVYIDAVDWVEDFETAHRLAEKRGELAIWEIAGGTEYRL